jgi:hypothetical protein
MSLASEFTTDPLAFLEKNAIYVPEKTDKGAKAPGIFKFELVQWHDTKVTNLAVLNYTKAVIPSRPTTCPGNWARRRPWI